MMLFGNVTTANDCFALPPLWLEALAPVLRSRILRFRCFINALILIWKSSPVVRLLYTRFRKTSSSTIRPSVLTLKAVLIRSAKPSKAPWSLSSNKIRRCRKRWCDVCGRIWLYLFTSPLYPRLLKRRLSRKRERPERLDGMRMCEWIGWRIWYN